MHLHDLNPVDSIENLRDRVDRMLRSPQRRAISKPQMSLDIPVVQRPETAIPHPRKTIRDFLDFISDAIPDGEVYLFGGVLRDLALLGRKGFNSDVDLVVTGTWNNCANYLHTLGAQRNKFGGYRLAVAGWPIDIWNAQETWAIAQGLVQYRGIASLTETTVLNWDAILMNWRTRQFVHRPDYLESIKLRILDIVLTTNPNPLGMAVRVFRHLCLKDAKTITATAAEYLAGSTEKYSFDDLRNAEFRSYGNSVVDPHMYKLFRNLSESAADRTIRSRFRSASALLSMELGLV